jgi:hypothetical protein
LEPTAISPASAANTCRPAVLCQCSSSPAKFALGDTGFFLGDILEVGGQLEYRYLYQFVGSLFRLHVIVLRHPAGTSFPPLESQLKEHLQILACRYPRTSELECPAIIVVVNHDTAAGLYLAHF